MTEITFTRNRMNVLFWVITFGLFRIDGIVFWGIFVFLVHHHSYAGKTTVKIVFLCSTLMT